MLDTFRYYYKEAHDYERTETRVQAAGVSCRNYTNSDWGQMESIDTARPDAGDQTFRRTEKIHRQCIAKGPDRTASGYGKKRACQPQGICGSTAKSRIFSHRAGTELKADS